MHVTGSDPSWGALAKDATHPTGWIALYAYAHPSRSAWAAVTLREGELKIGVP